MIILAIETSCDETAISVVDAKGGSQFSARGGSAFGGKILSNVIASQIKIHAKWGGVVPNLAKREHIKNLPLVLKKALGKIKIKDIDLIAVTIGPGLEPALWTGINFAKNLAEKWNKKIIGINHMEAHIFSAFLKNKSFVLRASDFEFPVIALLVSGGHTELVLIKDWLKYKIIGQTRDDAAGEAFDKVAKMLKLSYPGGPEISKQASKFKSEAPSTKSEIKLPRPMINSKDYDFSFSGLKTAVLYLLRDLEKKVPNSSDRRKLRPFICHEFQQAVIDVLIKKTLAAAQEYKVKTIILGGGVAANKELRKQLGQKIKKELPYCTFYLPHSKFTTDNAAMISVAAYFHALKKDFTKPKNLIAQGNLILK